MTQNILSKEVDFTQSTSFVFYDNIKRKFVLYDSKVTGLTIYNLIYAERNNSEYGSAAADRQLALKPYSNESLLMVSFITKLRIIE